MCSGARMFSVRWFSRMARVDVTAKPGCIYDGVPRPEGEVFDCDVQDAKVLKLIGKVDFDESLIPAEPPATAAKSKRSYKRKDMVAEG